MIEFCRRLAEAWAGYEVWGHPIEIGAAFQRDVLERLIEEFNRDRLLAEHIPYLAALICCSAFDIALHDAYGNLHGVSTYATYNREFISGDLADFLTADADMGEPFRGKWPADFLSREAPRTLPVWHLVGGLDPLEPSDLMGSEPQDGYPVLLGDWIDRDGLDCLKVKLRGNDVP